jgi:transglutaminase-like putative cysteine protease
MSTERLSDIRKAASACALLACGPLLLQLPPLMIACLAGLLLISFSLKAAPNRFLIVMLLLAVLALLVLEYRGRFGRDVAACMLALMMGLKCLETRSMRDLRAVLGFSLFLPFAALLSSQSPLSLGLSLLSMLFWLALVQACSTGELLRPTTGVLQSAKRIGMQVLLALPVAAALFWLFPRISTPLWGLPGLSNQGSGLGDSMKPGQWLDSLTDDRIAFRVTFEDRVPEPAQRYWRGPVLWDFDGVQWTRKPEDSAPRAQIPDAPADKTGIAYNVSLEPTERKYLPSLDWPQTAPAAYYLSQEATVYSDKPIQKVTQYAAASSLQPVPGTALDAATRQRALAFPPGFNKRTQALAQQWRAEAADDRAYIERVLQWIRSDFSYTLATELPGINAADDFLFTDKKGFCQHFSSSFALLMRAAGIPSRVVTGYAGGYKNPYGDYWVLYRKDAHAWNEVWLEDEGWVRVDPTAAVAPENILDTLESAAGTESYFGEQSLFSPFFDYGDFIKSRWNDWVVGFNAARQESLFKGLGMQQIQRWQLLILLMAVSAALSYVLFLFLNRAARPRRDPIEAAWQKLLLRLEKRGFGKRGHETALDFTKRIEGKAPWSAALTDVGARYTQWRYADAESGAPEMQALIADMALLSKRIRSNRPS